MLTFEALWTTSNTWGAPQNFFRNVRHLISDPVPHEVGRKRGQFPALWISPGSALHAHVAGTWLRSWVADRTAGSRTRSGPTTHEKTAGKTQVAFSHSRIALRRTSLIHEIHSTAENPPPIPKTPPDHSSVSCGCAPPRDLSRAVPWESRLAHVVLAPDGGIQSLRGCSVGAGSAYADE